MLLTELPTLPPAAAFDDVFDVRVEIHPGAPGTPMVAEIGGELDIVSAPWVRKTLLRAIRRHGAVICVDLQGVTFLDCSGVNMLLATARGARLEGGRMQVVRASARAWRVITLLGLQGELR